ncbi:MAG: hypothetical protein MRY74_14555 [Neomegalonema sp.]|nr:hypothetical protein [Neomegalonema sp.]
MRLRFLLSLLVYFSIFSPSISEETHGKRVLTAADVAHFSTDCKKGDPVACLIAGEALRKAKRPGYRKLFTYACLYKNGMGCYFYAASFLHEYDAATGKDKKDLARRMSTYSRKGCLYFSAHACEFYAIFPGIDYGFPAAELRWTKLRAFEMSCTLGSHLGCGGYVRALQRYRKRGLPEASDAHTAIPIFTARACYYGRKKACEFYRKQYSKPHDWRPNSESLGHFSPSILHEFDGKKVYFYAFRLNRALKYDDPVAVMHRHKGDVILFHFDKSRWVNSEKVKQLAISLAKRFNKNVIILDISANRAERRGYWIEAYARLVTENFVSVVPADQDFAFPKPGVFPFQQIIVRQTVSSPGQPPHPFDTVLFRSLGSGKLLQRPAKEVAENAYQALADYQKSAFGK